MCLNMYLFEKNLECNRKSIVLLNIYCIYIFIEQSLSYFFITSYNINIV